MEAPKIYVWDGGEGLLLGQGGGSCNGCTIRYDGAQLSVCADTYAVRKIELVWDISLAPGTRVLGDIWERGYGNLQWREIREEFGMPWYFLAYAEGKTRCFGVKTGPSGLCWWRIRENRVCLMVDISCGNAPVQLDGRTLQVCEVVMQCWEGDPFLGAQRFCKAMCPNPRLPGRPVYGGNDWYCNYGHNTFENILTHTKRIVECSPEGENRPYMVIDSGWQPHLDGHNGGPWDSCNEKFGNMEKMAREIAALGAIPGIWIRPLVTVREYPKEYVLKAEKNAYTLDPSRPEVLDIVREDIARLRQWGYRLIKHDFTTYDIFSKWGMEWDSCLDREIPFADRTKTTAQIVRNLYLTIREAAGDSVTIIGCNTLSHLSAEIFEIQRTGDDTSGLEWQRTKVMGINTLAFRMVQHGHFYGCDADCVGITTHISWQTNRKWLDLVSKSGTALFVSIGEDAYTDEVKADLKAAFARAAANEKISKPLDWMEQPLPKVWESAFGTDSYSWE